MAYIIRNNVKYAGGSGSGSGDTNSVELTQAEYDELLESGNVDDETIYFIKDDDNTPDTTVEIGDTYIGDIADGTITGAISELNNSIVSLGEAKQDTLYYYGIPFSFSASQTRAVAYISLTDLGLSPFSDMLNIYICSANTGQPIHIQFAYYSPSSNEITIVYDNSSTNVVSGHLKCVFVK